MDGAALDGDTEHETWFQESAGCVPCALPRDAQQVLEYAAADAVTKLGFLDGVFHAEARLDGIGSEQLRSLNYGDNSPAQLVPGLGFRV